MDALDALSPERPILSARLRRNRPTAPPADPRPAGDAIAEAGRLAAQLPVLVGGRWTPATPLGHESALLRLEAAVWAVAARHDVPVPSGASVAEAVRLLAAHGAVVPPAADVARRLAPVLTAGTSLVEELAACRVAARLTAYLELRAAFG